MSKNNEKWVFVRDSVREPWTKAYLIHDFGEFFESRYAIILPGFENNYFNLKNGDKVDQTRILLVKYCKDEDEAITKDEAESRLGVKIID
jgi:hypothetical protein